MFLGKAVKNKDNCVSDAARMSETWGMSHGSTNHNKNIPGWMV